MTQAVPVQLVQRHACRQCNKCRHICFKGAPGDEDVIEHASCIYCGRGIGTCGLALDAGE